MFVIDLWEVYFWFRLALSGHFSVITTVDNSYVWSCNSLIMKQKHQMCLKTVKILSNLKLRQQGRRMIALVNIEEEYNSPYEESAHKPAMYKLFAVEVYITGTVYELTMQWLCIAPIWMSIVSLRNDKSLYISSNSNPHLSSFHPVTSIQNLSVTY